MLVLALLVGLPWELGTRTFGKGTYESLVDLLR